MSKFRIIKTYDDHEPIVLGHVETDMGETVANELIVRVWDDFQGSHPDVDSDFIDWLVDKHGFRVIDDDFVDVCV